MVEHQQRQCQEVVGQRLQCADIRRAGGKVMCKPLFDGEGHEASHAGHIQLWM